jgi:hypothetical protein
MARLFLGPREMNFISDITKEVIKDVVGQKIFYYPISEIKTKFHGVYNEAMQKVFDQPIAIDALVDAKFQEETKINQFGVDQQYKLEVYIQYRDLVEKGIEICIGDFFSYSDIFYEITETQVMRNIYGQAEHKDGIRIVGTKARDTQFKTALRGPTDIEYTDPDAVQKKFEQQRGFAENDAGPTGDVHDLVKEGVLDPPLTGPKEVSEAGAVADNSRHGSAFYDED